MKKFFEKKVRDYKFRGAGQGHRLDEEKQKAQPTAAAHSNSDSTRRTPPSSSSQAAGQAALGRLEGTGRSGSEGGKTHSPRAPPPQTSKHSTSATDPDSAYGVKSEKPSKGSEQATTAAQLLDTFAGSSMIVNLVCPVCNRGVLHSEIHQHMNVCLHEEYIREPLSSSVQMIQSLCRDADRRTACVDTLCKYLDNITQHPDEEKYRKIRAGNKALVDKVSGVVGADLFLEAVGFQQQLLPHQDSEQQFYVLPVEKATDGEWLEVSRELLSSSGPLRPTLDRNVSLYRPSSHVNQFDLSADFFQLSVDEIRREQKLKSEAMERDQVLRTKAVRERDDIRATVKYYRFTLLRIRLPDGLFLQAVFRPLEKLVEVRQMVSGVLTDHSLTFSLSAFGQLLKNDSDSLAQLGLVPSAVLNLSWTRAGPDSSQPYMEPGLLARIQQL